MNMIVDFFVGVIFAAIAVLAGACGSVFLEEICRRSFVVQRAGESRMFTAALLIVSLLPAGVGTLLLVEDQLTRAASSEDGAMNVAVVTFFMFLVWRFLLAAGML